MRILAVVNQKGGCGKTTAAINLAASLAREGRRVLLVDLDPQGHCALGMAVPSEQIDLSVLDCLLGSLRGEMVELSRITWQITPSLDLAPSRADLATFEPTVAGLENADCLLSEVLATLDGSYSYVLVDCPPHVGLLTQNALRAATDVIIPIDTGYFSLHGLTRELDTIEKLYRGRTRAPRVRILPNQYDVRTKLAREILAELRSRFGERVFHTTINFNTKLKEGASFGQPITEYAPSSMGARDFHNLAREVIGDEQIVAIEAESLLANAERIAADAERLLATSTPLIKAGTRASARVMTEPLAEPAPAAHEAIQAKIDRVYGIRQTPEGVVVCLRYPEAKSVQLAGDFNNWNPAATSLKPAGENGDFEGTLRLRPGRYNYRLVIDGRWTHDKYNPVNETNEFGELNSVLEVT